jgi:subtilisin family serine protease
MSHGTHVAGTIAAQDNGQGVVGVAPQASLHIVRVFDNSGEFTASNLIVALNACADANANIISMSLGGPEVSLFRKRSFLFCSTILPTNIRLQLVRCRIPWLNARSSKHYMGKVYS